MSAGLAVGVTVVVLLTAGCFGTTREVTDSGEGLPQVTVDFPATTTAGATEVATFEIANPGPAPMSSVVVSFTRVGNDFPIVDAGARGDNEAVVSVSPEPRSVSLTGVEYHFGPLDEGGSMSVSFELRVPEAEGIVANSVVVYDGAATDRARGIRLQTSVQ